MLLGDQGQGQKIFNLDFIPTAYKRFFIRNLDQAIVLKVSELVSYFLIINLVANTAADMLLEI